MKKNICTVVGFIGFILMIGGPGISDLGGSLIRSLITMFVGVVMLAGAIKVASKLPKEDDDE